MFDTLSDKFTSAFKTITGKGKISESNIEDTLKLLRTALLEADVNFKVVKEFLQSVKEKSLGEKVMKGVDPGQQFIKTVHDELARMMGGEKKEINLKRPGPIPIMVVGLNGAGKTTFCGKLALRLRTNDKKNILLVPADTFRPAAKEQLIVHAKNLGIDFFDSDLSMSPEKIVQLAMKVAEDERRDIVIIDTAGRLQVDDALMEELTRVYKNSQAALKGEVLMVVDAMTGQEAVNVAQVFHEKVPLSGLVLSKMDSDTRGGCALSIRSVTNVPILFTSHGEKLKDMEIFHPDRLAGRILDMGDVLSLVEKAQEVINEQDAQDMMKKMQKNQFTIDDFLKQMEAISKLGPMESILKMIPGMGGALKQIGDLSAGESEIKKIKVLINSMTKSERTNHKILNDSRKKRIALGSGKAVGDINEFITRFEQMQKMMGGMMRMMGSGGMPGMKMPPGFGGGMPGPGNLPGLGGGMGFDEDMGGSPMPGFRQKSGNPGKQKQKGKRRNPFGTRFF